MSQNLQMTSVTHLTTEECFAWVCVCVYVCVVWCVSVGVCASVR